MSYPFRPRKPRAKVGKVRMIRGHHPLKLSRVSEWVLKYWLYFNRVARALESKANALPQDQAEHKKAFGESQRALNHILGGGLFESAWATLDKGRPTSVNQRRQKLLDCIKQTAEQFSRQVSFTVNQLCNRGDALLRKATSNQSQDGRKLLASISEILQKALLDLLNQGALQDLGLARSSRKLDSTALLDLVRVLRLRREIIKRGSESQRLDSKACLFLAEVLGQPAFEAFAAQEEGRTQRGDQGIVDWWQERAGSQRKLLTQDLAKTCHWLARKAVLASAKSRGRGVSPELQESYHKVVMILRITVFEIIRSGIFLLVV